MSNNSKNSNALRTSDKTGNFLFTWFTFHLKHLKLIVINLILILEAHLIAEKNEEIKMLNSIILGLHKKLSAVMETDVSELEM